MLKLGAEDSPTNVGICGRCPESGGKDCEELCDCMETHEMPVDEEVLNRGQSTPPFPLPFAPEFTPLEDGVLHWEGEESGVMISTSPEAAQLEMGDDMSKDESNREQNKTSGRRKRKGADGRKRTGKTKFQGKEVRGLKKQRANQIR